RGHPEGAGRLLLPAAARQVPEGRREDAVSAAGEGPLGFRVYAITDPALCKPDLLAAVREALEGGARAVQLRDKGATSLELFRQAEALRRLTEELGALLFVNDRLDVACAVGADGVHL